MGLYDWLILGGLLALCILIFLWMRRRKKKGLGCCGDCAHCASCPNGCDRRQEDKR